MHYYDIKLLHTSTTQFKLQPPERNQIQYTYYIIFIKHRVNGGRVQLQLSIFEISFVSRGFTWIASISDHSRKLRYTFYIL